jgi:hypothetical protein
VQRINEALETKKYCSADFLGISQAFDKVWHTGLLYKLRRSLHLNYYLILKSYLHRRYFLFAVENEYTELPRERGRTPRQCPRTTPVPPIHRRPANLTRIHDNDPAIASHKLQTSLLTIQHWPTTRRMKANGSKSTHVTFTTQRGTCPSVHKSTTSPSRRCFFLSNFIVTSRYRLTYNFIL